jgi:1-acyl-sn-glycerol-3-phosphate acyltransferase
MPPDQPTSDHQYLDQMETLHFRLWHQACFLAFHLYFTLGYSLRLQGQRNMPLSGPALIIANHQSFVDPLLCGVLSRRPLVYLARKTLFKNWFFTALIRSLNAIPIDQEGVGKEGLKAALAQLQLGRAVVIFPEGSRTPDGKMHPFMPGVHLLIRKAAANTLILPVGIAGAYDSWPIWRSYPIPSPLFLPARPGAIGVSLGKPFDAKRFAELPREQALQELFDRVKVEHDRADRLRRHD